MAQYIIKESKYELALRATNNCTKILSKTEILKDYPTLGWRGNGLGDRWANTKFNYSVIHSEKKMKHTLEQLSEMMTKCDIPTTNVLKFYSEMKKLNMSLSTKLYSENVDDEIPVNLLVEFFKNNKGNGIIGIFIHSIRQYNQKRTISKNIQTEITISPCVVCGTRKTVCDHKNDLYNDDRVLTIETQVISDFQPLCNHCNLQKRQICRNEKRTKKLYSAKNIPRYKIYPFDFPWEKKAFDENDINCKNDTYWFDPVEFDKKIYDYSLYVYPIITQIKNKVKLIS